MGHRNAILTVHGRRLIGEQVIDQGWSVATTAEAAGVPPATVYKRLARFRDEGDAGLADRTCRPHTSPRRLDPAVERRILTARKRRRRGPHQRASRPGIDVTRAPEERNAPPAYRAISNGAERS